MNIIERVGVFLPSKLFGELRAAGLAVAGVTCTHDEKGAVVDVQIISDEPLDETLVDTVCGAHDPAEPAAVQPPDPLAALEKLPPDQPVTASDLLAILRPDTMAADDAPAPSDHPAAGA